MPKDRRTALVRRWILANFQQLGCDPESDVRETILIRDGFYCGRRFEADGFEAVWFVEEGEIKVSDRDGAVREVASIGDLELADDRQVA